MCLFRLKSIGDQGYNREREGEERERGGGGGVEALAPFTRTRVRAIGGRLLELCKNHTYSGQGMRSSQTYGILLVARLHSCVRWRQN